VLCGQMQRAALRRREDFVARHAARLPAAVWPHFGTLSPCFAADPDQVPGAELFQASEVSGEKRGTGREMPSASPQTFPDRRPESGEGLKVAPALSEPW
jgi:hypothetical protein